MAALLVRTLLVLISGLAAVSASVAALLGLGEERILAFTGLIALLLVLPFLLRPHLVRPSGPPLVLAGLGAAIGVMGLVITFDPLDARVLLPVLVLLAAPNLARFLPSEELPRFVWRLLSCYVVATFLYQVIAEPAAVARGYESIVRYDPTGSVVMHSSLSLIHLLLSITRLGQPEPARSRLAVALLGSMSLGMVLLTATRTALLTLVLFAVLHLAAAPRLRPAVARIAGSAFGLAVAFAAWTAFNDSFWRRLTGAGGDFSSGRWASISHWLALAGDHPWGLGLGAVRERLAEGRPALDGAMLLEWPHNELVRFYIEAGPPGLLFVILLLVILLRRALRTARAADDPALRTLALAIAADLIAEALLQNLLNAIYHATVLILILALATAPARRAAAWVPSRRDRARPIGSKPDAGGGSAAWVAPASSIRACRDGGPTIAH